MYPPVFDEEDSVVTYRAHPLVQGFPGKSASHGAFGWSSVWLLRATDRTVLVETGPPSYIPLLTAGLQRHGLRREDVTDVLLTHAHWDHLSNIMMFPRARIWIGAEELAWARSLPADAPFFSPLHVSELHHRGSGTGLVTEGEEILPGIHALATPGHTPGHIAYLVYADPEPLIFAGDAVKNVYELATGIVDSTLDAELSRQSIDRLRVTMREAGAVLVPGHDVVLHDRDGEVVRAFPQQGQIGFFASVDGGEEDRSISATP